MDETRVDVLLAQLRAFPVAAIAPAALISWARRDPELAGVSMTAAEFDQTEPVDRIVDAIVARGPRLVGFSGYVWNHLATRLVARRLKERAPGVKIVFGGPEAAGLGRRELEHEPAVDYVCTGEGEETFRRLLRSLFRGEGGLESVPGLAFRSDAGPRQTAEAELIDLRETVSPYLTGLVEPKKDDEYGVVETSRGCPFTCTFCDWGPRTMRYVPEDRLEAEFARLAGATPTLHLTDADLAMNKARAVRLLETFLRATAGSSCNLVFELNPVFLAPEIVDVLAREPKKISLSFGIQTIREDVLRNVERTFDRPKIESNLRRLREKAPDVWFMFSTIYGLPGDGLQGLRETIDWCLRWRPNYLRLNHAQILPGTELEKRAGELGLEFQAEPPHQLTSSPSMGRADLAAARETAIYFALLTNLRGHYAQLLDAADARAEEPLAYARVLEDWIAALKSAGVEFPGSAGWGTVDGRLVCTIGDEAYTAAREDRLLTAAIAHVTSAVAERTLTRARGRAASRR